MFILICIIDLYYFVLLFERKAPIINSKRASLLPDVCCAEVSMICVPMIVHQVPLMWLAFSSDACFRIASGFKVIDIIGIPNTTEYCI